MIPPYLLATSAVDELTGRFVHFLLKEIRESSSNFRTSTSVDLFDWTAARLFYASGPALYGEGIFDGASTVLEDFRKFDNEFAQRMMLPLWMTNGFVKARTRVQNVLGSKFAKGLNHPSSFTKRRIEVIFFLWMELTLDSTEIWVFRRGDWK